MLNQIPFHDYNKSKPMIITHPSLGLKKSYVILRQRNPRLGIDI